MGANAAKGCGDKAVPQPGPDMSGDSSVPIPIPAKQASPEAKAAKGN